VLKCYKFSSVVAIIGGIVMAAVLIVFADPVIIAFAGDDPQMREIGALSIRLQSIALIVHGWVAVVNMLCAGLGNAVGAVLLATSRQGTCMLPILHLSAFLFGAYGIASVQAVADVLSLALAIPNAADTEVEE
jgi:Na+-driven multidrug efflux pump